MEFHARIGQRPAGLDHASKTEMFVRRCLTPRLVRGVLVSVFAWLC